MEGQLSIVNLQIIQMLRGPLCAVTPIMSCVKLNLISLYYDLIALYLCCLQSVSSWQC